MTATPKCDLRPYFLRRHDFSSYAWEQDNEKAACQSPDRDGKQYSKRQAEHPVRAAMAPMARENPADQTK
jgi:hypothetical protein